MVVRNVRLSGGCEHNSYEGAGFISVAQDLKEGKKKNYEVRDSS